VSARRDNERIHHGGIKVEAKSGKLDLKTGKLVYLNGASTLSIMTFVFSIMAMMLHTYAKNLAMLSVTRHSA
jgi:hypothetical protein